ncbi:MAG: PSD1 and planctomycete cytochrome C domain-containing protein [Planctomycetota bacterium]|nr:PSD1 and planctomycete cytochrome C domain-containing protein [Planctomycetota bacterium]
MNSRWLSLRTLPRLSPSWRVVRSPGNRLYRVVTCVCVMFTISTGTVNADDSAEGVTFFEKKIRPILMKHCYECHSAASVTKGELRGALQLDTREGIRRGGDAGPAVVPGKPDQSLLLAAIRHEQDLEMPPDGGPLPASVIKDVTEWITMGAPDPRDGKPVAASFDFSRSRDFWSLQPVRFPSPPNVINKTWPRSDLDRFVLARREERNIQAAADAPQRVLLRRLFFDIVGLPPTPDELQQFQSMPIEPVVDYLLNSPHFGERWGRHWLDVARFSESNGRARNMAWHNAWRYRDWVIDAFNADLPYDQFIAQQIAGDLLPAGNREQRDRQIIATGFLALGPKSLEELNRELFRMDIIDEQIDVICRGILGLSVSCARCHDHKFDPVPTSDYYALAGILQSTDTLYGIGPMGIKGVNDSALAAIGADADELAGPANEHLESVKVQTQKRNTARSDRYRVVRRVADSKRKLGKPGTDEDALGKEIATMEAEIKDWDERIRNMDAELAELVANPTPQPQFAMGVRDYPQPEDCRIRVRGEPANHGDHVQRGVLRCVEVTGLPGISGRESGRLQLAQWLTSRDNPLTARVMVNRVWQHLSGRGLVDTPDDFGATGSPPSHPLLLDYLTSRFMAQNWSMKQLIREIVLSRTYQLSSDNAGNGPELDPDNVLLWQMSLRRLEVEPFRDALLAVSGRLNPDRPQGSVIQQIGVFSDYEFNSKVKLTPEMINTDHRTVYLPVVRGLLPETLSLFDFADPNSLTGRRDETTVPSQALFLMNSPTMITFANDTAGRLLSQKQMDDAQRLHWLYELALARKPTAAEQSVVLNFLAGKHEFIETTGETRSESDIHQQTWLSVCQAVLASSEFRHVK